MTRKPWVGAIHRLLKAELRPDPRPKPGEARRPIYWNAADLAEAAQIRPNTLSDAMTGKREPSVSTLLAIATALQVPAASLFMDAEEAEAYTRFRHTAASTSQAVSVEQTVRRVLEQRAEQMKADWIAAQTSAVLAEITGQSDPRPSEPPIARSTDPPLPHRKRA